MQSPLVRLRGFNRHACACAGALSVALLLGSAPPLAKSSYGTLGRTLVHGPEPVSDCGVGLSESSPALARAPDRPRSLTIVGLADGGSASFGSRSRNGGRDWKPTPIPGSVSCSGGPEGRDYVVNPRVAAGPGGVSFHGSSWIGSSGATFDYGVQLFTQDGFEASWDPAAHNEPDAQDLVVQPTRGAPGSALIAWNHFDQVPNPFTYLPLGNDIRVADVAGGGATMSDPRAIYDPPSGLLDDPRLARSGRGPTLAFFAETTYADLAAFVATSERLDFAVKVMRSEDGGLTWSVAEEAGRSVVFTYKHEDTETDALFASYDVVSGRGDRAAIVWVEPPVDEIARVMIARSDDGGETWAAPEVAARRKNLAFAPAVAIGRRGREAIFFYDAHAERGGDARLDVTPRLAVRKRKTTKFRSIRLGRPFDFLPMLNPPDFGVDGNALGVTQDIVPLPSGRFGAAFTQPAAAPPPDLTDVVFARVGRQKRSR